MVGEQVGILLIRVVQEPALPSGTRRDSQVYITFAED